MSRRLHSERGWAMATVMGAMLVISLATAAAFAATTGDIGAGTRDVNRKQAYAAAEAGIQAYLYQIAVDPDFYLDCSNTTAMTVNQRVANATQATWTNVPNSTAQYAVELLPANGASACTQDDPSTVIDATYGTFRIRSTGRAGSGNDQVRRTIVATLRRPAFSDYVYFTDSEGSNIRFVTGDVVNGPLHTNDRIYFCGTPQFGTKPAHNIEVVGAGASGQGWTRDTSCGASALPLVNFSGGTNQNYGTWVYPASTLTLPSSNTALKDQTLSGYRFKGETKLNFTAGGIVVTQGTLEDGTVKTGQTLPYPPRANASIYVSNYSASSCSTTTDVQNDPYNTNLTGPTKCGTAWVQGTYSSSITVAAQQDVVVNGNLVHSGNAVMGLISNNFIRVYHPVGASGTSNKNCTSSSSDYNPQPGSGSGSGHTLTIEAAILSLTKSFTVDSYGCGDSLGKLNVTGAIAQKTRGVVGTGSGSNDGNSTGYIKNYVYDSRLKYRTPPNFLDPVGSSWKLKSSVEQVPALPAS